MIDAVDCQGFAGAFTLGMAQAGFRITAKMEEEGGFGVPLVEANVELINPEGIEFQNSAPPEWVPRDVPVVFGNPPCSGFSGLSTAASLEKSFAGTKRHGEINECMWNLVRYAAACRAQVVVMESVQAAYTKGRSLMQELRAEMERLTGLEYDLTHVLQNSAAVGGPSIRKRYFMVLSLPHLRFGIEPPEVDRVPVLEDVWEDLYSQPLDEGLQPYAEDPPEPDSFGAMLRSSTGLVDGHQIVRNSHTEGKAYLALMGWNAGEKSGHVFARLTPEQIDGSPLVHGQVEGPDGELMNMVPTRYSSTHAFVPVRLAAHKAAPVFTGTGSQDFVHPVLPRTLTLREVARVMGWPDEWTLAPVWDRSNGRPGDLQKWLGKGITVQVGRWIGDWVMAALEDEPGRFRGFPIGDRERVIDVTNDHKRVYHERTGEQVDSRSPKLRKEMEVLRWEQMAEDLGVGSS